MPRIQVQLNSQTADKEKPQQQQPNTLDSIYTSPEKEKDAIFSGVKKPTDLAQFLASIPDQSSKPTAAHVFKAPEKLDKEADIDQQVTILTPEKKPVEPLPDKQKDSLFG